MTGKVEFDVAEAQEVLRRALAEVGELTPLHQEIGEYMVDATRQRFVRGEAPDGTRWAAKSQATLDRYKRLGYGSRTRPLIGAGQRLSREIAMVPSAAGVVIGSALIYAGVMQRGAARGAFGTDSRGNPLPWGTIPARPWLDASKDDEAAITEMGEEFIIARTGAVRD